jgi:selenium metabolism protein YedF
MKEIQLDVRNLACPQPVIQTRNALKEGGFSRLEVVVDNDAALANVTRFAEHSGYQILGTKREGDAFFITIAAGKGADEGVEEEAYRIATADCPLPVSESTAVAPGYARAAAGKTVFIASDTLGKGEEELGQILMRAFLYALTELESKPKRIIFMNTGVKLAVEGAAELEDLRKLDSAGVEIIACGTCLEYYKLKEKLQVGIISNMYDIAGFLLEGESLSI